MNGTSVNCLTEGLLGERGTQPHAKIEGVRTGAGRKESRS